MWVSKETPKMTNHSLPESTYGLHKFFRIPSNHLLVWMGLNQSPPGCGE
jgi:hypothetical protein